MICSILDWDTGHMLMLSEIVVIGAAVAGDVTSCGCVARCM